MLDARLYFVFEDGGNLQKVLPDGDAVVAVVVDVGAFALIEQAGLNEDGGRFGEHESGYQTAVEAHAAAVVHIGAVEHHLRDVHAEAHAEILAAFVVAPALGEVDGLRLFGHLVGVLG